MSAIDMLLINGDLIGKGFTRLTKGTKFYLLYEGVELKAYIGGSDTSKQIIEMYNKEHNFTLKEEWIKKYKEFISNNEDGILCVVEKELLTYKEVKEKYGLEAIKADSNNKNMIGFRKYNIR